MHGSLLMNNVYLRVETRLQERIEELRKNSGKDLPEDLFEPLFTHLQDVIDIVASIKDYSTEPYLEKLRAVVCVDCAQDPQGSCVRRNAGMCGLNDYFPIIVGTIEDVLKTETGLPS